MEDRKNIQQMGHCSFQWWRL